jgi:hypothetical protein
MKTKQQKEKYQTKPINSPKNIYWKIRFTKRYPFLDNLHTTGIIGTTTEYIITKYLKFNEPQSKWFIKRLLETRRYQLHGFNINVGGYVVPVEYTMVSIEMIDKEIYKDNVYFISDDYTKELTSPIRTLKEWSVSSNMTVINKLQIEY